MAIELKRAHELSQAELDEVGNMERKLDGVISKMFAAGDKSVTFTVHSTHLSRRVILELKHRYLTAGWKKVELKGDNWTFHARELV